MEQQAQVKHSSEDVDIEAEQVSIEPRTSLTSDEPAKTQQVHIRPWHLFRFAGAPELAASSIGILFSFAQGGSMPLFAVLLGNAQNSSFIPNGSATDAMKSTVQHIVIMMIGMLVCGFIWQTALQWSAERQAAKMRMAYLKAILGQDTAWFDANDPAALPSRMAMEILTISGALGQQLGMLMMGIGQFFLGLLVAYVNGWKLALLLSATVPLFAIMGIYMSKSIGAATSDQQKWFAKAGAVAEEVLMAIRTVTAFGGERHEVERFQRQLGRAKHGGVMAGIHMGVSLGAMFAIMSGMYALAFWYGSYHLLADGMNPGDFMTVFFAVFMGVSSLQQMGDPLLAWAKAMSSASSMFGVLQSVAKIEPALDSEAQSLVKSPASIDKIEFNRVCFSYPTRPDVSVLKGLTLTIHKGQKVALVGESGSGKSTVIQLLERFYDPCGGQILINGNCLSGIPVLAWRQQLGYVGQEPVLFATSILDNIKGGDASISDEAAVEAAKNAQAFEFLNQLPKKFETFVGVGGGQMSGGQKQRIAIARALVKQPQVLLLDEATSALDNQSEKMVQETIDALQTSATAGGAQLTTISVAHRLTTVRNADVIFVLKQGGVCEHGSHEELMAKEGEYFCLVHSQETDDAVDSSMAAQIGGEPKQDESKVSGISSKSKEKAESNVLILTEKEKEAAVAKEMKETGFKTPTGRLFMMMKPQWHLCIVAAMAALVAGSVMPVCGRALSGAMKSMYIPLLPGGTVDDMLDEMNTWILLFGLLAIGSFIGEFGKYGLFNYIQECLTLRLRQQAFGALISQEIGFYDNPRNAPAGLVSTLGAQTSLVAQATGISLGNTVGALLAIFIGIGLAFEGCWQLTLAVLGVVPIVMLAMTVVMKAMMPSGDDASSDAYTASYEAATEAIVNIRTVRALVGEHYSAQLFSTSVDIVAKKESKGAWRKGLAFGFGYSSIFTVYIVAFWYGGVLIDNGSTDGGKMFQSLFCIMFGVMGASMAATFMPNAMAGQLAAYETFRIMDRKSQINAMVPAGKHCQLGDGSIVFEKVRFFYPHRPELLILSSLSLRITPGSSVAFVGPSGCGKSTVLQLFQRFYDPTSGDVKIGGVGLSDFDVSWWRQQIGFVGQEPVLFDISLEDNVRYGKPNATRDEIVAVAKTANMDYVNNGKMSWEDLVGPRGGRLSGGQKQRCAIARALSRNPAFLILDEATSALDSASEHVVQAALDAAKQGRTTIAIAHRLSTIKDSDAIFVLKGGRVAESGTQEELLSAKGVYWNLAKRGAE
jgi:ATP-binding cassette subfamily B (MDR/TAP) protein 1